MDLGLDGRVAIVTGASSGLGRASAQALLAEGARVVACARGRDRLETLAAEAPGRIVTIAADVRDPQTPARLVGAAQERFGRLDVLVANAGGPPAGRALDLTRQELLNALDLGTLAMIALVQAAVPFMRQRAWGRVCLITSVAMKQPIGHLALSNVARAGLWGWAKTAARDLFPSGISLTLVCPGSHATPRFEALNGPVADLPPERRARVGDPADFGRVVAFLCSAPARFLAGGAVSVDGAATMELS